MELTRITEENMAYFQPLMPDFSGREDLDCFGLIGTDGSPIATMVLYVDGDMISLEWIYVHPDYRRKRVGSKFLDCIAEILEGEAVSISASYSDEFTGLEEFFEANGFFLTMGDQVWFLHSREIIRLPEIQKLYKFRSRESPAKLSSLLSGKKREVSAFVERETGASVLLNSCDPEMSFKLDNQKGGTVACLLTEKLSKENYLLSLLFNLAGETYGIVLLKALLERFLELDMKDALLQFVAANESVDRLVQSMLGTENKLKRGRLKYAVLSLE